MKAENRQVLKIVSLAFVTAFILIGLGILLYVVTLKDDLTRNPEQDRIDTLKTIQYDVENTDLGGENDGFVEIDNALLKLRAN